MFQKFLFGFFAFLGLALFAGYIYFGTHTCKGEESTQELSLTISPKLDEYKEFKAAECQNRRDAQAKECQPKPPIALIPYSIHKEGEGEKQAAHIKNNGVSWMSKFFCESKISDAVIAVFTYGLFVATGWLVWATLKMWDAGERQLKTARQIARLQARQTRDSIREARRAADAAMAAIGNERAWMCFDAPNYITATNSTCIEDGKTYDETFGISINFVNRGRTPATMVNLFVNHFLIAKGESQTPKFHMFEPPKDINTICGPDHKVTSCTRWIYGADFEDVINNKKVIVLYGCAMYKDIFNSSIWRKTECCAVISADGFKTEDSGKMVRNWQMRIFGPQNSAS